MYENHNRKRESFSPNLVWVLQSQDRRRIRNFMKKKKKMMSDHLPRDMEEEVLCRIPLTSLGLVRSTCKRWSMLTRCDHLFASKHLAHLAAEEAKKKDHPLVVMMMNYRVELMRLNLSNNEDVAVVNPEARLIGLDQIDVREIFHCDGLLLCIPKEDHYRLLVWNPYWGRGTLRWIEQTHNHHLLATHLSGRLDRYTYGLGYDSSSSRHYKILRFIECPPYFVEFKIYDFNSDSWRILDPPPRPDNWNIHLDERGISLKGSTYWFAAEDWWDAISFLVCFDYTTETFSPPLPLPFEAYTDDTLILSSTSTSVQQLVVLFVSGDTLEMEIWISNTIEQQQPNAALSWNTKVFLSANIKQLIHPHWNFLRMSASFFIDQEKNVAVVFDKNSPRGVATHDIAYIFVGGGGGMDDDDGSSSSLKQQVVKESPNPYCYSRACYYVPSLVQLN